MNKQICYYCNNQLTKEEYNQRVPDDESGDLICDKCRHEHYEGTCPICQNYFDLKIGEEDTPANFRFILLPEQASKQGMKPGLYKGTGFPIWTSDIFSQKILHDNVELVRKMDITKFVEHVSTDRICDECFNDFNDDEYLRLRSRESGLSELDKALRASFIKVSKKYNIPIKYLTKLYISIHNGIKRRKRLAYLGHVKRAAGINK